jgi:hypothetical protein
MGDSLRARKPRTRSSQRDRPGLSAVNATARANAIKISALQLEVESAVALGRRHSEELAVQFKRIAQLQAEIDELKKILRAGG